MFEFDLPAGQPALVAVIMLWHLQHFSWALKAWKQCPALCLDGTAGNQSRGVIHSHPACCNPAISAPSVNGGSHSGLGRKKSVLEFRRSSASCLVEPACLGRSMACRCDKRTMLRLECRTSRVYSGLFKVLALNPGLSPQTEGPAKKMGGYPGDDRSHFVFSA